MLALNTDERQQIDNLICNLLNSYKFPCDETFMRHVRLHAGNLPPRVLASLNEFKYENHHNGTLLLRGLEIDDNQLEKTPLVTDKETDEVSAAREGFMLMLIVSLLGDAFGWSTQRNGALINNILPIKSQEAEQLSTGSSVDLDWHTEEAFHHFRADYLVLMCLRNPDDVPTVIGSIDNVCIDEETKKILFEPRFIFHADKNFQDGLLNFKEPVPVLFGDFSSPYIRIDPSFMNALPGDSEAGQALDKIIAEFKNVLCDVVLRQGDILVIDNFRVVHGRKAFRARFDGTDRWLKRVNITADLRKSRLLRESNASRVILTS